MSADTPPKSYPPGMMGDKDSEFFEITYKDQVYKCRRLAGFQLLNSMTNVKKGMGYMLRDIVFACLVDPRFTRVEIEEAVPAWITTLGVRIVQAHDLQIEDFQESMTGLSQ